MCDRECDCKTCQFSNKYNKCGSCYPDSLKQCKSGGIHNCRGYVPYSFFKRLWYCITNRLEWWQI